MHLFCFSVDVETTTTTTTTATTKATTTATRTTTIRNDTTGDQCQIECNRRLTTGLETCPSGKYCCSNVPSSPPANSQFCCSNREKRIDVNLYTNNCDHGLLRSLWSTQ